MLNLTVRMVPLLAQLAADPQLAIHLTVVVRVEVDLVAVVTLLIGLEALEAEVTEADLFAGGWNLDLVELGLLLVRDGGDLLLSEVQKLLPLPLRQVEGAPVLVIAELLRGLLLAVGSRWIAGLFLIICGRTLIYNDRKEGQLGQLDEIISSLQIDQICNFMNLCRDVAILNNHGRFDQKRD